MYMFELYLETNQKFTNTGTIHVYIHTKFYALTIRFKKR